MKEAEQKLCTERYGKGLGWLWKLGWGWKFYVADYKSTKNKFDDMASTDDNSNFITVSDSLIPIFYSVTDKQFKSRKKQKFFYKFRWF